MIVEFDVDKDKVELVKAAFAMLEKKNTVNFYHFPSHCLIMNCSTCNHRIFAGSKWYCSLVDKKQVSDNDWCEYYAEKGSYAQGYEDAISSDDDTDYANYGTEE